MGQKEKNRQKRREQEQRPKPGIMDVIVTLLPAVLVAGLRTFAAPCMHEDGSAAACTTAGTVLLVLGVVTLVLAVMRLLGVDRRTRRSLDLFLVIAGIALAVLPGTILPLCMMETMRCRAVMMPFARIIGAATAIVALACELTVDREVPAGRKSRR